MSESTIERDRTQQGDGKTMGKGTGARRRKWPLVILAGVLVAGAVGVAVFAISRHASGDSTGGSSVPFAKARVRGLPADVSTHVATIMRLQPVQRRTAPGFTLTDQHGKTLSLSSFRGHVVVLTFMDDRCHTICPIVSKEFINAEQRLARTDPNVVFAAVNVNKHALGVETTAAFTRENRLSTIPTWHFFTGKLAALRHIWKDYGIEVETQVVTGKTTTTVSHSSLVYFIAPNGTERFLASPTVDYTLTKSHHAYLPGPTVSAWGRGIALVASGLAK